jgi:hypothetical protein
MHVVTDCMWNCISFRAAHCRVLSTDYCLPHTLHGGEAESVTLRNKRLLLSTTHLCAAACTHFPYCHARTRSWKSTHMSASCGPVNETAAECADLKYPMYKLWCWVWTSKFWKWRSRLHACIKMMSVWKPLRSALNAAVWFFMSRKKILFPDQNHECPCAHFQSCYGIYNNTVCRNLTRTTQCTSA